LNLGKKSNFGNGVLTRQAAFHGVDSTIVPDYFVKKSIEEVVEEHFWISIHHLGHFSKSLTS